MRAEQRTTDPNPESLGPYHILEVLGKGGMGVVYRAVHGRSGCEVALKVVLPGRQQGLTALQREISALKGVHHPGIARILDAGEDDHALWCAMEYIEGEPLTTMVRARRRKLAEGAQREAGPAFRRVLAIAHRLSQTLAYLHGRGLIHRDIKPANILLRPDDWPVLVDFGVAIRWARGDGRDHLEPAGIQASGTASFMAPELLRGEAVDARADLYSLGCVLYTLLAGHGPHRGGSLAEILRRKLTESPEPLGLRTAEGRLLERLVAGLLARSPWNRIGFAEDLVGVLERLGAPAERWPGAPPAKAYLYRPDLVGRRDVMRQLRKAFGRLDPRGATSVAIFGRPGVGKSRLALEWARELARRRQRLFLGRGSRSSFRPLGAFSDMVSYLVEQATGDNSAVGLDILGRRASLLAPCDPRLGRLGDRRFSSSDRPDDLNEARLVREMRAIVTRLATHSPFILMIDDAQWMDRLSFRVVESLLRTPPPGCSIALLCTVDEQTTPRVERLGASCQEVILLEPLSEAAVREMTCQMLAVSQPPDRLLDHLTPFARGRPLYVQEFLQAAVATGLLVRAPGAGWRLASERADRAFPTTMRALVDRHLAGLSAVARRLAEFLALAGGEAGHRLLRRALGGRRSTFDRGVLRLLGQAIVVERREGVLSFRHDRYGWAVREALHDDERRRLSTALAMAAEVLPQRGGLDEARLAELWEWAGETDLARPHWLAAARLANRLGQSAEAETSYRRVLEGLEEGTERLDRLDEFARDYLMARGRVDQAEACHREAYELARRLGDDVRAARAAGGIGDCLLITGTVAAAERAFREAYRQFRTLKDATNQARLLNRLAIVAGRRGDTVAELECLEEAVALLDGSGPVEDYATALQNLAALLQDRGQIGAAAQLFQLALDVLGDDHPLPRGRVLMNLATLHFQSGDPKGAARLLDEALEVQRQCGDLRAEAYTLANAATLVASEGEIERAGDLIEQAQQLTSDIGDRYHLRVVLTSKAAYRRRYFCDLAACEALLDRVAADLEGDEDLRGKAFLLAERGHLAIARSRTGREELNRLEELTRQRPGGPDRFEEEMIGDLRRAVELAEAGRWDALVHGDAWSTLRTAEAQWLRRRGARRVEGEGPAA